MHRGYCHQPAKISFEGEGHCPLRRKVAGKIQSTKNHRPFDRWFFLLPEVQMGFILNRLGNTTLFLLENGLAEENDIHDRSYSFSR
jgi:hypothetical protein